jgi:hypothetical protein
VLDRVRAFDAEEVPAYRAYQRARTAVVARARADLRIDEHRPQVMRGFVRNRLIDAVYLPLIGDNLERQFGAAGGVLLLVSPPGYGKTTLVEYVANRLGLLFVKVDGPSLGHATTSLDPARAPDSGARREVEKILLALRLGTNVMLYLDDIQHTSPELLQRFVSLCDAQRQLAGYDLRGKRFAVCLAGNPYTESGRRFRIPDMLANRADVWNLGDVVSGRADLFASSFLENALGSNPVLAALDPADLPALLRTGSAEDAGQAEVLAVLRHLTRVRDVVLAVNRAYIASAGQPDSERAGPPFRLQGSYRDLNAIARRLVPVMSPTDVDGLIDDHYRAEAQTLGGDAESNLRRLAEIIADV